LAPRPITVQADAKLLTIDLARTAIVVIDMQNDFCHPDGWLAHIGVDVGPVRAPITPLQRLLPALRSRDVPVIWLNWGNRPDRLNLSPALLHVYKPSGTGIGLGDPLPGSGAKVLERGSWSAAIVDELTADPSDIQVEIPHVWLPGYRTRQHPAQSRRHHADVCRRQCRPMRAVHAAGRQFSRL
jgi:nicotinamidase-related amidase